MLANDDIMLFSHYKRVNIYYTINYVVSYLYTIVRECEDEVDGTILQSS